jgi:hypothetical protein
VIAKIVPVIGRYLFWLVLSLAIFAAGDFVTGKETLRKSSIFIVAVITTGFVVTEFIRSRRGKSKKGPAG